jgi:anti-sigma factor RsiW
MKCDLDIALLSGYLDKELSKEQLARVEAHLKQCAACRKELEELKQLDAHLRASKVEEPSREFVFNLNRQVMGKINKKRRGPLFRFAPIFVPAAVAVLILFIMVYMPGSGKPVGLDHQVSYSDISSREEVTLGLPEVSKGRHEAMPEKGYIMKDAEIGAEPSAPAPLIAKSKAYRAAEEEISGGATDDICEKAPAEEYWQNAKLEQIAIPDDRVVRAIIDTDGVVVKVATGNTIIPERDTMLENCLQGQQLIKPATVSGKKSQVYVDFTQVKETTDCTTEQ